MNRRTFLTGLLASSALAPFAVRALTPGDWIGIEGPAVNTSLWQISWGEQTAHSFFPITLEKWRYLVKVANIEIGDALT